MVMMIIVAMNCKSIDEDARVSINVYSDGYGDGDSQECAKRQSGISPKLLFHVLILKTSPTPLWLTFGLWIKVYTCLLERRSSTTPLLSRCPKGC